MLIGGVKSSGQKLEHDMDFKPWRRLRLRRTTNLRGGVKLVSSGDVGI